MLCIPTTEKNLKKAGCQIFYLKKKSNAEYRFLRPDGSIVWVMGNAVPEWIDNEIIGYIGTIADITGRKQMEETLRESEEKYRLLIDTANESIIVAQDGQLKFVNNMTIELLEGYSEQELIGRPFSEFIHPDDKKMVVENYRRRIANEAAQQRYAFRVVTRTGIVKWVEINAVLIEWQGKPATLNFLSDITERKRAEEVLIESESSLRNAQEIAKMGSWEWDMVTQKTNWSGNFFTILGFEPGEIEPNFELFRNKIHLDDVPFLDKNFATIMKDKTPSGLELRIIQTDGTVKWNQNNIIPVIEDDKLVKLKGVIIDITERKKAEEILRESEEKYRRIFENVQDLYYETSMEGTILEVSPSIMVLSKGQYHPGDLIGKSMYNFYSDSSERDSIILQLKKQGTVSDFEITLKNKDGSFVPCSISSKICLDAQGHPEKIIGSMRDITDRKRAEEAIIHERRMLRTLIDNLPDHIYVKDIAGRKVISNIADFKDFGFQSEDQVLGKTDLEIFPFPTGQRGHDAEMEVLSSGKPVIGREEDFVYPDGKKHWSLSTMIPLIDNAGKINGLVGIGHDITERKHVEEELIKAKEKAEESDRLKTAFLHNISHEIRTPMNAIVGFSALLSEPALDEKTQQTYIETIMDSSNHLLAIINDIVDISNIEANLVKLTKNDINLNISLKSICNQFRPKAEEKKITLECESRLSDSEASIIIDGTKLTQVISNLISNSLKFTNKGYIKVICDKTGDFLQFSVSDTGIGIPPEQHSKIFERFYQVQNLVSRIYEGTGLGLSISKAYVELMGGKIWLSSEPGKGSTFSFTIPSEKQIIAPLPAIEKTINNGFVFPQKKKILVAEDIDSNYKLITYFLSGANTTFIRACNGKEAVEKALTEKNIDLILMDIKMPEMDGYTAVRLIREAKITIPIIAQTAYEDDESKAKECGCDGFISKPFNKKGLLNALSNYI
jgi:PAS domain S-box-containing protein